VNHKSGGNLVLLVFLPTLRRAVQNNETFQYFFVNLMFSPGMTLFSFFAN